MTPPRHFLIFLSSPGDVPEERSLALQVIDRLQYDPLLRGKVTFEIVAWDKPGADTPMLATMTPQEAINQGLPMPSQCDIVVVILWSRMGTPLPYPDYQKADKTPFLSGTEWEYEDALEAARLHKRPEVVIYRRTEPLAFNPDAPDFEKKVEQYKRVKDFFARFQDTKTEAILRGSNAYEKPENFREKFETHLKVLVKRLIETPAVLAKETVASPPLWQGSPFPGLRAFTPEDEPIFFGHGRETDALVKRLNESRFVAVVGASGSGKSSLVGAGLIPRLKANVIEGSKHWLLPAWEQGDWVGLRFAPGEVDDNPFTALAVKLAPLVNGKPRQVADQLASNPAALETLCAQALQDKPEWAEILLFIDQFEELFTTVNPEYVTPFVKMLAMLAPDVSSSTEIESERKTPRLRVVVTLRADFYQRCLEISELAKLLQEGSYPLSVPGTGALYEMIVRPAERAGLIFEPALADRILGDTGGEPGALPLMAYALDELYRANTDGKLTWAAYEAMGGVAGAIGSRAEKVFNDLDAPAQKALPEVFRCLVAVNADGVPTRRRAQLSDAAGTAEAKRLVTALADPQTRLLVLDAGGEEGRAYDRAALDGEPTVEVAHEALFRSWSKLKDWIDGTKGDLYLQQQVKLAAVEWDNNKRSRAYVWPAERLKRVYEMMERLPVKWNEIEQAFIDPEANGLVKELDDSHTTHQRRSAIGERLSNIGDSRQGVSLRADGLPDIAWCYVSAGKITLEEGAGAFEVKPFYAAQYPITYIQFKVFLDDPLGFNNAKWWEELDYPKQPMDEQHVMYASYPRDSVSWYQVVAFTRWLNAKLQDTALPEKDGMSFVIGKDVVIRLPTEWEWQQAASGGDPLKNYPWGKWDETRANTRASGLNRTTAVGMYPAGASPFGAKDMSGNVFEWCLNAYENAGDASVSSRVDRALRGGSFASDSETASLKHRYFQVQELKEYRIGFRVCAAPEINIP